MKRVLVIGSAGAGKSTLALALKEILDLPVIHLDSVYWQPGWVETPKAEWQARVESLLLRKEWIMDGNYGGTLELRLQACDTVFYLDFPRLLCLLRVFKRSLGHLGRARPDMNQGCRERLPNWGFLHWIWTYPDRRRPSIIKILSDAETEGKRVFIVNSPGELANIVEELKKTRGKECSCQE